MADKIKKFDVIVIGAGSGLDIASFAHKRGHTVAVIEEGPMGGTCLNRGCIPSKMVIHSADIAETIKNSQKFGIMSRIEKIDFASIVQRVSDYVDKDAVGIEESIRATSGMTLYKTRGKFVDKKIIEVDSEKITAEKILLAAPAHLSPQSRVLIPSHI